MEKIRVTVKNKKISPALPKTASFPIVGIGGSAGGLEAFQELLKNLSAKPGVALVFIMHLSPGHKSMLTELLARLTKMPVSEITNGMPLEVNHVYVIPPRFDISIASGKLILSNMKDAGLKRMPIDYFFRSLAEEQGNRAVGVILSGTATDGTLGIEAIKAEGGITFAQDEKSAKYVGMPQSAIATGCVDFVLSPKKIASEIDRIAKHLLISSARPVKTNKPIVTEDKGLESIFDILRSTKGLDFTHYKTTTISRRLSRRILLLKLENLKHYIKFLRENKDEVEKLYEDLLLNVTSFFRDPKVFHTLKKLVLPAILKNKTKDQEVRIWVPGCSSGEEAYSIAICLIEALGNKTSVVPIKIFATDVSESGINKARQGIYGANIKNDVTPERLKRFFTKQGNSYKISKSLREMCIFSKHNVFSDPPFSNLDLISCRNLLIYLQPVLQKSVFHKFHYGLRPDGFLLLGNSEFAGGYSNLFKTLDRKQRIFVKKYLSIGPELELCQKYYSPKKLEIKEKAGIKKGKETDIESMVERIVLSEYAPCGVLIDSDMEVISFRGHTGRYLESGAGKPSLNIFKLAREGLSLPLRAAIYKARETKHTVKREAQDVRYNGRRVRVNITVVPAKFRPLKEEFFLVLFDEIGRAVGSENLPKERGRSLSLKGKSAKSDEYIDTLQKELIETKEYLQAVIEEQESANEEVKTANEEILSSNEELQSTNEELETAKEELQSSNEELITSNEELQNRNAEAFLLNNDLINLLSSINMPVIMMGTDLAIRRITSQAEKVLNVIPSDIGRPISRMKLSVDIPDLEKTLMDVIKSLHPKTFEIKDREGNWYSVYIRPYRTLDNKIDGVVAVFVDITERKKAAQITEEARAYAENIIEAVSESLIVLDADLKVISANRSFYQTFKFNPEETQGRFIYDLGGRQWNIPGLRKLLEEIFSNASTIDNYEVEHNFETTGPKTMLLNARLLASTQMILLGIMDITERKRLEYELAQLKEKQYRTLIENLPQKVFLKDINSIYISCNENYASDLKIKPKEIVGKTDYDFYPKELADKYRADDLRIITSGKTEEIEERYIQSGKERFIHTLKTCLKDDKDRAIGLFGIFWDITERKQAEKDLQESMLQITRGKQEWESTIDSIPHLIFLIDNQGCILRTNRMVEQWNLGQVVHLKGKSLHELMHPGCADSACCLRNFWLRAWEELSYNRPSECEVNDRIMGRYLYIQVRPIFPVKYIESASYAVVIVSDVTERKQTEVALRESEEKFRTIFDNAGDGILLADIENKKFYVGNNAICQKLGYSPEEIKNLGLMDIQPEKDISDVINLFERQVTGEFRLSRSNLPVKTKDGSIFYADINATTINIAGKTYQITFFHDVTEQKIAEEEKRLALEIKTATEIKSKFISMVSHELRSPLGVIKEGINLVLEGLAGNINDAQKDLLDTAKRNTDRLSRLINDVLDFDKIKSGKMEYDIRENDINEVALEVCRAMSLLAEEKGLDLVADVDDNIPKIMFDKDKIIQVFTNLVSNAIKYTEKGSISISTKQEDNMVHVIVQDTGVGIEAKNMQKLFQAFEQLDNIRGKKKGGTGLGLAISKEIILAHEGKIWAESEAGKGSAFHFTIPKKLEKKKKIGEILVEEGKITEKDLEKALEKQEKQK
jgi:two-component system CheB/CheR fusion protein